MNPNPPMYVLQTRQKHLGSFHSLMLCLKVVYLQVVVAIIVDLFMVYFQIRNKRSLATDYRNTSDFLGYMGYFSA